MFLATSVFVYYFLFGTTEKIVVLFDTDLQLLDGDDEGAFGKITEECYSTPLSSKAGEGEEVIVNNRKKIIITKE